MVTCGKLHGGWAAVSGRAVGLWVGYGWEMGEAVEGKGERDRGRGISGHSVKRWTRTCLLVLIKGLNTCN